MRCMLKIEVDTEAGNRAVSSGDIGKLIGQLLERTKPEAVYFAPTNGNRTAYVFFDLADPSDMPWITEPAFQGLNAKVSFTPVMTLEDLQKGMAKMG